jgi:hypothetical protein
VSVGLLLFLEFVFTGFLLPRCFVTTGFAGFLFQTCGIILTSLGHHGLGCHLTGIAQVLQTFLAVGFFRVAFGGAEQGGGRLIRLCKSIRTPMNFWKPMPHL